VSESAPGGACPDPAGTVGAFLCHAGQHLRAAAIENPRLEARLLLAEAMGTEPGALLGRPRAPVPPDSAERFAAMLRRRLAHEPMAFILGRQGFWTLELEVSPDTLIPRADSEAVVEAALAALPQPAERVLDLGTGTGCLLLAVLSEWPDAFGVGVDLSPGAAALAARNAAANGLAGRAAFLVGDWESALSGRFDLVLSNPPYIARGALDGLMPEVVGHEPQRALDGGEDGLDAYRHIVGGLAALLMPQGCAVLELGQGQRQPVAQLAEGAGLAIRGCKTDLNGIERALVLTHR